eukprot:623132-Prymnesium_polylepis.1
MTKKCPSTGCASDPARCAEGYSPTPKVCGSWARAGFCARDETVPTKCPAECCNVSPSFCPDGHVPTAEQCESWASSGRCMGELSFMARRCVCACKAHREEMYDGDLGFVHDDPQECLNSQRPLQCANDFVYTSVGWQRLQQG